MLPTRPPGLRLNEVSKATIVVEMFQDICCPFSKNMYQTVRHGVIPALSAKHLADNIEFVWQSVPQPWHPQSGLMHDALMAAYLVDASKVAIYIDEVFARQDEFFDDKTKHLTRVQIYDQLIQISGECGYDIPAMARLLDMERVEGNAGLEQVTQQLKWAVKYHRVRGVHVTPTVFINGIEADDISSSWDSAQWLNKLEPMFA